jgi:hypothetical protein
VLLLEEVSSVVVELELTWEADEEAMAGAVAKKWMGWKLLGKTTSRSNGARERRHGRE